VNKAIRLAVAKMGCTNRGKRLRRRSDVIRVEESVEINRPVEEVFSYTSTPENLPKWAATVRGVRRDSPGRGPLREGERFTAKQQALGRKFEAPFEVIDYEPNRRYAHRGAEGHPVPVTMVFAYEPLSSAVTRFTPRIEAEPGGFFVLVGAVFEKVLRRQLITNLVTLKDLLERREAGREPAAEQ
jgi:uncharacterized membrane protein